MNIFNKIKSVSPLFKKEKPIASINLPEISMSEREDKIYGKDKLILQKLYEQWSCKDKWLLHDEGIPLLFGLQPGFSEVIDDELKNKIESLWKHAQECVQKKMLSVINVDQPEDGWEVRPLDLYCWATVSRISMPDEFSNLMTFVAQTIKPIEVMPTSSHENGTEDMLYQRHREIVLGAATSLLVNAPDLCRNNKGRVVSNKIAKNIIENEDQWFGNDKPLLAEAAMTDLINEYLKLTKPLV
jgi:hypothetical protein